MLALIVAATMLTGGVLSILLSKFITANLATLALLFIMLCGALLLGSLGLQIRVPLLLVPTSYRPAAILLGTLAGCAARAQCPEARHIMPEPGATTPLSFTYILQRPHVTPRTVRSPQVRRRVLRPSRGRSAQGAPRAALLHDRAVSCVIKPFTC